jgi:hypothetical protein
VGSSNCRSSSSSSCRKLRELKRGMGASPMQLAAQRQCRALGREAWRGAMPRITSTPSTSAATRAASYVLRAHIDQRRSHLPADQPNLIHQRLHRRHLVSLALGAQRVERHHDLAS